MNVRNPALALVIGTVMALLVDAALQIALAAVQSPGVDSLAPWWVIGRVVERSVWVAAALLIGPARTVAPRDERLIRFAAARPRP